VQLKIPPGSIIQSASLNFTASSFEGAGTIAVNIYANASNNAVAPISDATFNALVKTTTTSRWTITNWAAENVYSTLDLKTIVQEVINQPGWIKGNAIMFLLYSASYYNEHKERFCYGFETGNRYPFVKVTYS
jgi:hypothetical protein